MSAPVSTRVAEKVSGLLSSRFSRRGFFARSAVVGSAVAVSPVGFALKPTTAYAAVCNCQGSACQCGSLCCDGYTEFCCTLTGNNKCPPGTLMGGWWKADGSGMCSGARYYMDCNAPCNGCGCGSNGVCGGDCSGTGCGCANGDCNNRKAGCTQFRYGQCNQSIPCIGPILCRVVTCLAPWDIDPTCTTALRVDQATLSHDRPCLHRTIGALDSAVEENGRIRVRGWALDYDTQGPVRVDIYSDNQLIGSGTANVRRDDVAASNPGHGPFHGFDFLVDGNPGSHDICAYAINAAGPGADALLGCRRVALSNPFGGVDWVGAGLGKMKVKGWAIDPDTTGTINVRVYVNNVFKGEYPANKPRPDVSRVYPGYGDNHGYEAEFPIQTGTKNVCVYAVNVGAGSSTTQLGCVSYVVGTPFGAFETVATVPGGLRVEGWAIDPDITGPIKVHVYVDGKYTGETVADIPRSSVGAKYPQYGSAHGFEIEFPVAPGSRQVCVYALNDDPTATNPAIGCRTVDVFGVPLGSLDNVWVGPGKVTVRGWAIDPDIAGPVTVHVYVDGKYTGEAVADQLRTDVGKVFKGYGDNHGFQLEVPAAAGTRQVCVYALNDKVGTNPQVGCKTVEVLGGVPVGSLDNVWVGPGKVTVRGWAIDPDIAGPVKVHVYVDGKYTGEAVADQLRTDVGKVYKGYGDNHGYLFDVPAAAGTRQVCVYALNDKVGTNPQVGCKTVEVLGGVPLGSVDNVWPGPGKATVRGWAIDPDIAGPVTVKVFVDGTLAGQAVADQPRTDVGKVYKGYGDDHGFVIDVPATAGSHQVCVSALNDQGGTAQQIGCKTAQLPGGNPLGELEEAVAGPGSVRVVGWAIDPDTANPVEVHFYSGQTLLGKTVANLERPEVGVEHPGYGAAHGFDAVVPLSAGFHEVCAFAINTATGTGNPVVGCLNVFVGGAPFGSLDNVTPGPSSVWIRGWVIDPDIAGPTDAHVYIDGKYARSLTSDLSRPDVEAYYPLYGPNHGFAETIPLSSGSHEVCVFGINKAGNGDNPLLACRTVVI